MSPTEQEKQDKLREERERQMQKQQEAFKRGDAAREKREEEDRNKNGG